VTSKEDVLWAIVDRAAGRFEAAADAALARADAERPGDPVHAMAAIVRAHVHVVTEDVGDSGVFVHEWRSLGPQRRAGILARRDAYEARFRHLIAEGIAVGAFGITDPAVAATVILTALNGVATWYTSGGRLTADRIADHLVGLVGRMLACETL
jgi:TetR/AcrR family transcriptional regulator, cholesterol catabolism regulator